MIGLIVIIACIIIEVFLLAVIKPVWLKGGLFSSIMLGIVASIFLILAEFNSNPENYALDAFFLLNIFLPIIFGFEIHLFSKSLEQRRREKRAKREIIKWDRRAFKQD